MREVIMKLFRGSMQDVGELENVKIRQKESWHEPIPADALIALILICMIIIFFLIAYSLMLK